MGGISEVTPGPKMLMPSLWKFAKIQLLKIWKNLVLVKRRFSVGQKQHKNYTSKVFCSKDMVNQ